ncbi:MAG: LuxR C-terminal-related transcriptional regulator [Pseudomonadota bacterium]
MTKKHNIEPIIRTKLHRPPVASDHVHRGELLNRLARQQHRPLTLVSAPAGYGKSTLVSCWLTACDDPSTWVSLDEHDSDLRGFLSYLIAAIQSVLPGACGEIMPKLGFERLPDVSAMAINLINELDRFEKPFILVLDDYHRIRDKKVHELIADLLRHPSAVMHLVLIGRRDPPLPLASLRAKGQMLEIRTRDLRFSLEETLIFLQQTTGAPVGSDVAAILEERTEGWVTGLRLAALAMMDKKDVKRTLADLPLENRHVMEYVVSEILSLQPPPVQTCLLKSAVLNRFSAPLCDAVFHPDEDSGGNDLNGHGFLELAEKANLFVIPLDDERLWFRYHHLFQSLLKRQLEKRFEAAEIADLHKRAAAWLDENGYIEEALSHAHESGDEAAAARLVKRHRHEIMNREQWYRLNRWLKRFSPDLIEKNLDLLMTKAWVVQRQARYSELFVILDALEQFISASDQGSAEDSIYRGELQVLKSFQQYAAARGAAAASAAREALRILPGRYHSLRGSALLFLSAALQMQGDPEQARQVVLDSLRQEEGSIPIYKTMLLAALCYVDWISADLNSLKQTAAQMLKHGQQQDLPETIVLGNFFSGIRHYQRNELDLAERFLASVVGTPGGGVNVIPSVVTHCQSAFALSLTFQAMGRAKEAGDLLESLTGTMLETGNADLLELCKVFRADLALRQGRVAEADLWAQTHSHPPLAPAFRFYTPQLILPRVLLAGRTTKGLREADALLSRMIDYYTAIHSTRVLIHVFILKAMVHAAQGDESQAFEKLAAALTLAEPGGFIRPFLDQGSEMAELLGRFIKKNPALQYAGQIFEAFGGAKTGLFGRRADDRNKPGATIPEPGHMEPLSNREIEVLKMLATGLSNNEIAEGLFIAPDTVKKHLSTIYRKLDVNSRQKAVVKAGSIGIL